MKKLHLDAEDLAVLERVAGIFVFVLAAIVALVMGAAVVGVAIRVFLAASGIGGK